VKARRATRLATVAVGYADGFLRSTGASGGAWLDGVRMPLMGRVSMDSIIVDAGDAALQPGDLVDLIGPQHDADAAGAAAGTIGYEILTSLGHRFARRIIGAA
jgi:alanine racemase